MIDPAAEAAFNERIEHACPGTGCADGCAPESDAVNPEDRCRAYVNEQPLEEFLKGEAAEAFVRAMGGNDEPNDALVEAANAYPSLDRQIGGDHYRDMAIGPTVFCQRNELNWCESNIVKYTCRHHQKGGKEDIEKVIHYAQMLLELEYGQE